LQTMTIWRYLQIFAICGYVVVIFRRDDVIRNMLKSDKVVVW
jgi:hypothetical protein